MNEYLSIYLHLSLSHPPTPWTCSAGCLRPQCKTEFLIKPTNVIHNWSKDENSFNIISEVVEIHFKKKKKNLHCSQFPVPLVHFLFISSWFIKLAAVQSLCIL